MAVDKGKHFQGYPFGANECISHLAILCGAYCVVHYQGDEAIENSLLEKLIGESGYRWAIAAMLYLCSPRNDGLGTGDGLMSHCWGIRVAPCTNTI